MRCPTGALGWCLLTRVILVALVTPAHQWHPASDGCHVKSFMKQTIKHDIHANPEVEHQDICSW